METSGIITFLAVLFIVLVFVGMLWFTVTASRKEKEAKAQMARMLGATPVPQPDAALVEKIDALYRTPWAASRYVLRNVSRRTLPDGEMFLFDLVDNSGDGDSITENQAVAIRSTTLRLPPFQFYPKLDTSKYALGKLANTIVEWGASKVGAPVNFPEYPAFQARYSVTSSDPQAVTQFFDERLARYFAGTEYYSLHAGGDLFVFAEVEPGFNAKDQSHLSRRINRALEIYRLFQR